MARYPPIGRHSRRPLCAGLRGGGWQECGKKEASQRRWTWHSVFRGGSGSSTHAPSGSQVSPAKARTPAPNPGQVRIVGKGSEVLNLAKCSSDHKETMGI